eukprot:6220439-Amphidinium_carterae.1
MSLEQDKHGVPQYQGNPELWQGYVERAKDLFYARIGKEEQAVTALHLRAGLRGVAYESVRGLAHDELITRNAENKPTIQGVELLLRTLEAAIAKEKPLRIQERFEK